MAKATAWAMRDPPLLLHAKTSHAAFGDADGLSDADAPGFGDGLADAPAALGKATGFGGVGVGGLIPSNSTSKISIAFGPMSEPAPRPPYARSAGIKS